MPNAVSPAVSDPIDGPSVRAALSAVLRGMLVASLVAIGAMFAIEQLWGPDWGAAAVLIALASAVISVLALLPGLLTCRDDVPASARAMSILSAGAVASAIRMAGTVALLVTCSYHMHLTGTTIGLMVGGCYLFLTTVEIVLLVRNTSRLDAGQGRSLGADPIDQSSVLVTPRVAKS